MVLTLHLCVLYDLRTNLNRLVLYKRGGQCAGYCAVGTETLYKTDTFRFQRVKKHANLVK